MSVTKRNLRGLRDIRTLSGQTDETSFSHRAHMKLACLEMEKARRNIERKSAIQRLQSIDARVQDIEAQEAAVRKSMASRAENSAGAAFDSGKPPAQTRGRKPQFKVKY